MRHEAKPSFTEDAWGRFEALQQWMRDRLVGEMVRRSYVAGAGTTEITSGTVEAVRATLILEFEDRLRRVSRMRRLLGAAYGVLGALMVLMAVFYTQVGAIVSDPIRLALAVAGVVLAVAGVGFVAWSRKGRSSDEPRARGVPLQLSSAGPAKVTSRPVVEKPFPDIAPTDEVALEELKNRLRRTDGAARVGDASAELIWMAATSLLIDGASYRLVANILAQGLEKYPDDPRLLISSSYVWGRSGRSDRAVSAVRRAYKVTKGRSAFEEQHYLAASNLCFLLAEYGADEAHAREALEMGKLASQNADRFENRDSFVINYGFAQMRFAKNRREMRDAVRFLRGTLDRDLTCGEMAEVAEYLAEAARRLQVTDGAAARFLVPDDRADGAGEISD